MHLLDGLDFEENLSSQTCLQGDGCSTDEDYFKSFFRLARLTDDQLAAWLVKTEGLNERVNLAEGVFISLGNPDLENLFKIRKETTQRKFGDPSHYRPLIIQHSGKGLENGLIFLKQHGRSIHLCRLSKTRVTWEGKSVKRFNFEVNGEPVEDTKVFTFDHLRAASPRSFEIRIRRPVDDLVVVFEAVGFSEVYDSYVRKYGGLENVHRVRVLQDQAALKTALICLT